MRIIELILNVILIILILLIEKLMVKTNMIQKLNFWKVLLLNINQIIFNISWEVNKWAYFLWDVELIKEYRQDIKIHSYDK